MSLLTDIEAFLHANRIPASVFGTAALRDPGFVTGLRNGREARAKTERRARDFMAAHIRGEPLELPPKRARRNQPGIPISKARRQLIAERDAAFRAEIETRYGISFAEYRRQCAEEPGSALGSDQVANLAGEQGQSLLIDAETSRASCVGRILQSALDGRDIEFLDPPAVEHARDDSPDRHARGVIHPSVPVAFRRATVTEGGTGSNPGPAGGAL